MKTKKVARSSITGKFVSIKYANDNPNTTIIETIIITPHRKERYEY